MPIAVCPSCGKPSQVPDHSAGKALQCPHCKRSFTVGPLPFTRQQTVPPLPTFTVNCSACRKPCRIPASAAGQRVNCPNCQAIFLATSNSAVRAGMPRPANHAAAEQPRRAFPPAHPPVHEAGVSNSLGISSLVLGCVAFVVSLIPCVGAIGMPLSGLGLLLGIVGLVIAIVRNGRGIGFPIAGIGVCGLALLIGAFWLSVMTSASEALHADARDKPPTPTERQSNPDLSPVPGVRQQGTDQKQDHKPPANGEPKIDHTKKAESPNNDTEWSDASKKAASLQDVSVQINSVTVDYVTLKDFAGQIKSGSSREFVGDVGHETMD
jgi:hypothetical protein